MNTFDDVINLAVAEADLKDDQLETLFLNLLKAGADALQSSIVVDQNKGDMDVSNYVNGFTALAGFAGHTSTLSDDQVQLVREAVNSIVDVKDAPLLTAGLESLFAGYLNIVVAAKRLKEYADALPPAN